jgi:hypothetical protein
LRNKRARKKTVLARWRCLFRARQSLQGQHKLKAHFLLRSVLVANFPTLRARMASGFVTLAPETLSQQVNRAVEPLVDALSSLVLECIGGSMKDVSQHAVKLADSTNVLITIAQKVALAESDEELTTEIINSINFIADQIELLVSAFSSLLSNRTDPTAIKNFATAAQNVGDAINTLVVASDETSQKRMTSLVRYATSPLFSLRLFLTRRIFSSGVMHKTEHKTIMRSRCHVYIAGR